MIAEIPTSAELAPASGAGIGRLVAAALLADPNFIPLMRDAFLGALAAKINYYDREAKEWRSAPDYRTRLQAVMGCIAHMEGEPIRRVIHQHLGGTGPVDPLAALQDSPALRDAARRMLEKAEYRTGGGARRKAQAARERAEAAPEIEV